MDEHTRDAAALSAVYGHAHDFRDTAPLIIAVSPTKRCGKTRLERVFKRLVPRPLMVSGMSPPFLARVIEKHRPFLLLDEWDALLKGNPELAETVRGQLNSSFDRDGAQIGKCVPLPGGGYDERMFSTWAPTMGAAIGEVPDTVQDRGISLRLKRKLPKEKVARFRGRDGGELGVLARKIARFVADNEQRLREIEPQMPEKLSEAGDRAPDAWEPLVAIADVAGGEWPKRARKAALALALGDANLAAAHSDVGTELLSDISKILDACDALNPTPEQLKNNKLIAVEALQAASDRGETPAGPVTPIVGLGGVALTNALAEFTERKWTWNKGKPMSPNQLTRLLRPYGVLAQTLRDDKVVFWGYPRDRLDDAIGRYLNPTPPDSAVSNSYTRTSPEKAGESENEQSLTVDGCKTFENLGDASNSGERKGVRDLKGKKGGVPPDARPNGSENGDSGSTSSSWSSEIPKPAAGNGGEPQTPFDSSSSHSPGTPECEQREGQVSPVQSEQGPLSRHAGAAAPPRQDDWTPSEASPSRASFAAPANSETHKKSVNPPGRSNRARSFDPDYMEPIAAPRPADDDDEDDDDNDDGGDLAI